MANDYLGALIYDSAINLAGLERDKNAAITKLHSIGAEATKTFKNDIARSLAKSVRPEVFAGDLEKSRALLQGFGNDATKIFERALGRQAARRLLAPFIDESKSLTSQLRAGLSDAFSIRNIAAGFLSANAITGVLRGLFDIGKATVNIARDAEETRNRFNETFRGLSAEVRAFANSYAQEVGRSRIETESFLATISGIFTTVGFAGQEAAEFSKSITKLTFDLASFFNTTDSEALTALRSGLIGESEPLRRFNVFLSEARVAQEALAQGINKTSKELTEQDKVFLRYQIILKDTITAQGDAIRTSDSLANQQKRLSANFQNLGETLGQIFVPALADATKNLNTLLENLTKTFTGKNADLVSSFFGNIHEEASRMQAELDAITNKSKNTTAFVFPGMGSKFDSDEAAAIKAFFDYEKKSTLDIVTIEAERKKITEKTKDELEEIVRLGGEQRDAAREELRHREQIAQETERTRKELEAIATIKLPDYLTKSKSNFEFGKIRGANNSTLSDAQFKRELEVLLNIKLTPALKLDTKKIIGVEKITNDLRDALSDIGFPFKSFLIDLEKNHIATESELVQLADLINRGFGDVFDALFEFVDKATDPRGTILGQLLAGSNFFITAFTQAQSLVDSAFRSLFGESDLNKRVQDEVDRINSAREAEAQRSRDLIQALKDVEEALKGPTVSAGTLIKTLEEVNAGITEISGLTRNQISTIFDALRGQNFKPATTLQEFIDQLTFLSAQKPELLPIITLLQSIKDPNIKQALTLLFGQFPGILEAISKFGTDIGGRFDALIKNLNTRFDLLNIDDAGQKLDALQKEIKKKFGAIIPTTQSGIRDLITQGLAALEAGGDTLLKFLASLDLEEFAPDDLREFLLLLNGLANDLNEQLGEAADTASESVISQVRLATFEQTNALIDNTVTMRIVLTNILDAERQMLELARRNVGLTGSGGAVTGTHDRFFFFNDGVISETTAANLSQLQRRMYNDAAAQAGGKGLS